MKSKKIIFTVTNDLNYDQRMIRICKSLHAAGYEVVLVGRKKKKSPALNKKDFQQKRIPCFFEKGKLFYLEFNFRLFWYLCFASCDAICSIDLDTILPGFLVGKMRNKKIIYDAHEYYTETPEVVRRPLVKAVWEMVARLCIPRIKYAYTVGGELQKIFSERYGLKFDLIRNLPLRKEWNPQAKTSPPIILYQGVLNEGRGISETLEAMQQIDNAQLWLLGEGDISQELRAKCKTLGLENKVKFKGYIQPHDLPAYTAQATIGINLLENRSLNYYYSLANKTFDYIQAGIPALNMDFPEYQYLNQRYATSILLPDLNPNTIAVAIKKLLEEEEYYQSLVSNCKIAAKEWIWENEEKRLVGIYQRVFNATQDV